MWEKTNGVFYQKKKNKILLLGKNKIKLIKNKNKL